MRKEKLMSNKTLETFKEPIKAPKPLRVMINAGATAAFYDCEDDTIRNKVIERLVEICRSWRNKPGIQFISSFDDDLLMTGDPRGHNKFSIYILLDVEEFDSVVGMVDDFRQGSVSLARYFTVEASVGRPFWPIEPSAE